MPDPTNGGVDQPTQLQVILTYDLQTRNIQLQTGITDVVLLLGILGVGQVLAAQRLTPPKGADSGLVVARGAVPPWPGRKS